MDTRGCGIVIQVQPDEFIIVGKDLDVTFQRSGAAAPQEIEVIQEGRFVDGQWIPGRVLNGDERTQLLPLDRVGVVRIKLLNPK